MLLNGIVNPPGADDALPAAPFSLIADVSHRGRETKSMVQKYAKR
jgi:hypothetical protein